MATEDLLKTSTGLVFNDKNQILMVKHKKFDKWVMPGGKIEIGESPCVAVEREVLEETGLNVRILPLNNHFPTLGEGVFELPRPFCIWKFKWPAGDQLDFVYLCRVIDGQLTADETEVTDIGWFSAEEIKYMDSFDNVKMTIDRFLENRDTILNY